MFMKNTINSVLITGANSGLGKEAARQLAESGTKKIYLGCRNRIKAKSAKEELEKLTGKFVFEILLIDVSNLDSVREAVTNLPEPVEALILNAGGMGGKIPGKLTKDGVTFMFATNVLGHTLLLKELAKVDKLTKFVLYAGSEAARGVPLMKMNRPQLKDSSVNEFIKIIDGSFFGDKFEPMSTYGYVKYIGALWMASAARQYPELKFITMSPGASTGSAMSDAPLFFKIIMKYLALPLMKMFGKYHALETGAKRYVRGLNDSSLDNGRFYASEYPKMTGDIVDQSTIFEDIADHRIQDNANEAIHHFLPET